MLYFLLAKNTIDNLKGVLDLLKISNEKSLKKLHSNVIEVMHKDLTVAIYKHIAEGNTELKKLIYRINKNINIKYFQERTGSLKNPLFLEPPEIMEFVKLNTKKESEFLEKINKIKKIIIYGAGKIGVEVADYLKKVSGIEIICFAVSDKNKNPDNINGIPVESINDITEYKEKALVLIATSFKHHQDIKNILQELLFRNILPINYNEFQLFGTKIIKT